MGSKQPHGHLNSHVVGLEDPSQVFLSIVVDLVIMASLAFPGLPLTFQTQQVERSRILRNRQG